MKVARVREFRSVDEVKDRQERRTGDQGERGYVWEQSDIDYVERKFNIGRHLIVYLTLRPMFGAQNFTVQ